MMTTKYFLITVAAGMFGLTGMGADYLFDFENAEGNSLPKGYRQVKDRNYCGGTFEIVNVECGKLTKAVKVLQPEEKKTVRILMERPKVPAKAGDRIDVEFFVKGKGKVIVGFYGNNAQSKFNEYGAANITSRSEEWQKVTAQLNIKKENTVVIMPFLQSNVPGLMFTGLKVTVSPPEK